MTEELVRKLSFLGIVLLGTLKRCFFSPYTYGGSRVFSHQEVILEYGHQFSKFSTQTLGKNILELFHHAAVTKCSHVLYVVASLWCGWYYPNGFVEVFSCSHRQLQYPNAFCFSASISLGLHKSVSSAQLDNCNSRLL